jgi:hypothetical protein
LDNDWIICHHILYKRKWVLGEITIYIKGTCIFSFINVFIFKRLNACTNPFLAFCVYIYIYIHRTNHTFASYKCNWEWFEHSRLMINHQKMFQTGRMVNLIKYLKFKKCKLNFLNKRRNLWFYFSRKKKTHSICKHMQTYIRVCETKSLQMFRAIPLLLLLLNRFSLINFILLLIIDSIILSLLMFIDL